MKKLVVSLAVLVSSLGFAQESDTLRPEDVIGSVQELFETIKNDKSIKSGDYDAPFLVGLAKTLFTDSTTKYKYAERNPKIADMEIRVNGAENIDYETWLTEYVKVLDTSKYEIHYKIVYYGSSTDPNEYSFNEIIIAWDTVNKEGRSIYFEYYKGCLMSIINF